MSAPRSNTNTITRVAYGISQLPRIAWYLGHGLALRRLAEVARRSDAPKARRRVRNDAPVPDRTVLCCRFRSRSPAVAVLVEARGLPLFWISIGTNSSPFTSRCPTPARFKILSAFEMLARVARSAM